MKRLILLLPLLLSAQICLCENTPYLTQTVYGFLDFTTTMGNTVMVFIPQSAPALDIPGKISVPVKPIKTKPIDGNEAVGTSIHIAPTKINVVTEVSAPKPEKTSTNKIVLTSTSSEAKKVTSKTVSTTPATTTASNKATQPLSSSTAIYQNSTTVDSQDTLLEIENNLYAPEYDLLSRQPTEYAEETYRVVNLKNKNSNSNGSGNSGSTGHTANTANRKTGGNKRNHGNAARKHAPAQSEAEKHAATPVRDIKTSSVIASKTATASSSKTHRSSAKSHRNRNRSNKPHGTESTLITISASGTASKHGKTTQGKFKRKHKNSSTTPSFKSSSATRKALRNQIQATAVEPLELASSSFKLNRSPGRWQYKSSAKPKVTIRKLGSETKPTRTLSSVISVVSEAPKLELEQQFANENFNQIVLPNQADLESSGSHRESHVNNIDTEDKEKYFEETLNVEVSTPANFKDTYYEIATIKKPYTFQAGNLKKTRFVTITSTLERVLEPEPTQAEAKMDGPLTENILLHATKDPTLGLIDDSSIETLQAIHYDSSIETPALETVTDTFSITQRKLKTQVLPIIYDSSNETIYTTLVQTIDVTSLITAVKTISPQSEQQATQYSSFKDFAGLLDEAGSEINLDLHFGDDENAHLNEDKVLPPNQELIKEHKSPLATIAADKEHTEQLNALNIFNMANQLPNVITTTQPVVKLETLWQSHVVPLIKGQSTIYRTLSKSIGVVEKTEYQVKTTTLPALPTPPPQPTVNPFFLPFSQIYQTITTAAVQPTVVTQTNSKVLKLTFGARTAYTTLYATEEVPTIVTQFVTTTVPVQATSAFPGYFPQPFPPYYVG